MRDRSREVAVAPGAAVVDPDVIRIVEELQIHQIELEMQNEELREAQASLETARARYSDLFDFAPVAYCTLDARGIIQEANLTAATLFERPRARLLGRSLATFVLREHRALLERHLAMCLRQHARVSTELAFKAQPEPFSIQLTSSALFEATGAVSGCRCALTDISALKRSERLMRLFADASEALSATFAYQRAIPAALRLVMPLFCDAAFAWLVDVRGEPTRLGPSPHTQEGAVVTGALADVTRTRTPVLDAGRSVIATPLLARGRLLGVFAFLMRDAKRAFGEWDVALANDFARRAASAVDNAELFHATQSAVRTREDILSIVSHDLRNPLHAIMLSASDLVRGAPATDRRKGRRHLDMINRATARMERLLSDLLDLSGLEAGQLSIDRADHVANDIVQEACHLLGPIASAKDITLEIAMREPNLFVLCDRQRIAQVLCNIIGNALKFVGRGDVVRIEFMSEDDRVHFAVRDNGPGIAPRRLPHIFDRYWRGDESRARRSDDGEGNERSPRGGRGLGLHIAKGLIDAQDGRIWAESAVGIGTTLHFTLPRGRPRAVPAVELAACRIGGQVLVVDDDPDNRELLATILRAEGFSVRQAGDGEAALQVLRESEAPPLAVLLDLAMPGMDGWTFIEHLRECPPALRVPVVLVSSQSNLREEAARLEVSGWLEKPVRVDALLKALQSAREVPA